MENNKEIRTMTLKVKEIGTKFGNPRKISKKEKEKLKESLKIHGDFGLFLINENKDVIAGNQRLSILKEENPETEVLCKMLIGYSDAELRAINIKDNTHNGEWDLEMLANWTADLTFDLGLKDDKKEEGFEIKQMELIHFEKYNYVMIVCDNEIDYNELTRNLGIDGAKMKISKRTIQARAVWYKDMKSQIIPKEKKEIL